MLDKLKQWITRLSQMSPEYKCPKCGVFGEKIEQGNSSWFYCWKCENEWNKSWGEKKQ